MSTSAATPDASNGFASPGTRRVLPVGAIAVAIVLMFAGAAYAAFHTVNGINHGLGSTTGGGVGAGNPYAAASDTAQTTQMHVGMFHLRDDGGWNTQCETGWGTLFVFCEATQGWGTAPCRKYAWAEGLGILAWHGHNGSGC